MQIQLGSMFCIYLASLPVVDADGNTSFAFGICTAKSPFLIVNVFSRIHPVYYQSIKAKFTLIV